MKGIEAVRGACECCRDGGVLIPRHAATCFVAVCDDGLRGGLTAA